MKKRYIWFYKYNNRRWVILLAVLLGIGLLIILNYNLCYVACLLGIKETSAFFPPLQILIVGLPTYLLFWFYRTYDIREQIQKSEEQIDKSKQQIEKSQQQILQGSLFEGIKNLTDNAPLKIEVGTQQLIILSKNIPSSNKALKKDYDNQIKLAFIKRLKIAPEPPKSKTKIRYTYAQHIMSWLSEKEKELEFDLLDLQYCDFSNQEFNTKYKNCLDILKIRESNNNKNIMLKGNFNFRNAFLQELNLNKIQLEGVILNKATLRDSVMIEAKIIGHTEIKYNNIRKADLINVNFQGATLKNLDLTESWLFGANLKDTTLENVNLTKTNLSNCDLTNCNMNKVGLNNAFWSKQLPPNMNDELKEKLEKIYSFNNEVIEEKITDENGIVRKKQKDIIRLKSKN